MESSLAAAKIDAVVVGMELSDDIKMQWQAVVPHNADSVTAPKLKCNLPFVRLFSSDLFQSRQRNRPFQVCLGNDEGKNNERKRGKMECSAAALTPAWK